MKRLVLDASIPTKIYTAFGLLLVLITVLGGVSLVGVRTLGGYNTDVTGNWMPALGYLGELKYAVARHRSVSARHILSEDKAQLDAAAQDLVAVQKDIDDAWAKYLPTVDPATPEKQLADQVEATRKAYLDASAPIFAASSSGDKAEAERIYRAAQAQFSAAAKAISDDLAYQQTSAAQVVENSNNAISSTETSVMAALGTSLILAIGAAWTIVVSVSKPIRSMTDVMGKLAASDFAVVVPNADRKDEVGAMARALEVFRTNGEEAARLTREMAEAERRERAAEEERRAEVERRRAEENAAAEARRAEQQARTEHLTDLIRTFEGAVAIVLGQVTSAVTQLRGTASGMTATAEETTRQAQAVAAASEEASANVQTVASAAEELSVSVAEIGRRVGDSTETTQRAVNEAEKTRSSMMELNETTARIGKVVDLIAGIAAQTNLLALNATIEAARAGEAGKGFAVVASEVKALATQKSKATEEIGAQIAAVQQAATDVVTAIDSIGRTIHDVNGITVTIASSVEEQGAATQEIARNVQEAARGTQEVNANISGVSQAAASTGGMAEQVLVAVESLTAESERLRAEVDGFLAGVRAVT